MSDQRVMQQEAFNINLEASARKKIVRQDRIPVAAKRFYLAIGEQRWELLNISSFGLAIICKESDLGLLEKLFPDQATCDVVLKTADSDFQQLRVRRVRVEKHPQSVFNDFIVGFETAGEAVAVDCVKAFELANEIILNCEKRRSSMAEIPMTFRLIVFEMKNFLLQIREQVQQLEGLAPRDSASENDDFRETVAETFSTYLNRVIPGVYQKIPQALSEVTEDVRALCTEFIREQLGPLVYGAPFANRAYNKPRGYAGDYEMMNHLYRNEIIGASLFDQCMHRYFIDEPAAQAVKNRGLYLLQKIRDVVATSKKTEIRILAVASGPAMEQQLFLKNCREFDGKKITFVCIDQDEESLKHAQREILSIDRFVRSGHAFRFMNLAIKNILGKGLPEKNFDLIYTAGLFDYFTDPVAQMAAARLYEGLAENGQLIVGNFSTENPSQAFMEMVLEWHLIYRSEEEMSRLFKATGKSVKIEKENLGINLFAVIK